MDQKDKLLYFHPSFRDTLKTFRSSIASISWLLLSINDSILYYEKYKYITMFDSSVVKDEVKIDKSILELIRNDNLFSKDSCCSKSLVDLCRVFTITFKDLVWENDDFKEKLNSDEIQFLRYIRNASAHGNKFYWGKNEKERERTIKNFPITWREKKIEENLEGRSIFFDFLAPGDLFILLSDISVLVKNKLDSI